MVLARWGSSLGEHGNSAVFTSRLLPLARTFVSLPAGAQRVPLGRFVVFTTAGCGLWAVAFVLAGLVSGSAWAAVSSIAGKVLLGVGLVVVAGAAHRAVRAGRRAR